jgi:hypothetical protein
MLDWLLYVEIDKNMLRVDIFYILVHQIFPHLWYDYAVTGAAIRNI